VRIVDRFNIILIRLAGPNAFLDIAELLQFSLLSLGAECSISTDTPDPAALNIVLGYQDLASPDALKSCRYVVYQLEQLPNQHLDRLRLDDRKMSILNGAEMVWDFSLLNIAYLETAGLAGVRHLPIGFHPGMARVRDCELETDVLFYGTVNRRRKDILNQLAARCRVKTVFGAYGERRDTLIGRSRIVLNLRAFTHTSIMEQARLAYLMGNGRFALSEDAEDNAYGDALAVAPYEGLVDACLAYLADEAGRRDMARRGRDFMATRPMTALVGAVL
jgi:hypothetical protein